MIEVLLAAVPLAALPPLLAATTLWYAAPIAVVVSLVCAATRHELMQPILVHAARFCLWLVICGVVFMGLMVFLDWLA